MGATPERTPGRTFDLNVRIAQEGYANATGLHRPAWSYRSLHAVSADHFISEVFRERHTLSTLSEEGETTTLQFCPKSKSEPWIEGQLVMGDDETFVSASWIYGVPGTDQEAGGQVTFVPWMDGGEEKPHLLSARGVFWLRHENVPDRFHQSATISTWWLISDDHSAPRDCWPGRTVIC